MSIKDKQFTNFKIHSQYSICEGAIKIDDIASFCKTNKIKALGLSDSFNLCGALEFSEKLGKIGTQPIIGTQINFIIDKIIGKIPLFATNENGYKNLTSLSSKSYLDNSAVTKPHCNLDLLQKKSNGLIVLTGSQYDLFGELFKIGKLKEIEETFVMLKEVFKDRFYIEIQRHNEINEKNFEVFLLKQSAKLNIPIIASQEVFYLQKNMAEAHDALICIGEKTFINDINRIRYTDQHYLKPSEELIKLFSDLPEALVNNFNFPYRFNFKPKKTKPILPTLKIENNITNEEELLKQAQKGLEKRLKNFVNIEKISKDKDKVKKIYQDRLTHEIKIINSMDFSSYFLIVSDYIKWSKKNGIPVGPGRGSGAGSLVAYCLDITDLDPIEFDLIFERFLNPDRITMPDFDIDFCEEKRDKVFEYLKSKYKGGVAHIITFGKLKARMALRDVGRVLGLSYGHVDKICKMIPFDPSRPLSLQESIDREPRLRDEAKNNKKVEKLLEISLKLEGLNRNMATHAAGVVIAHEDLSEQVPLYQDHNSNLFLPSTQFDMYSSENAGLVKFDLLGLTTLTIIDKTLKMLEKKKINLDISKINLTDKKVYEMISTGATTGLFQLESTGMRESIRQMKPSKFDDIIALVALYRPGPMSNIPIYNDCKNGNKKPNYIHESLENILKPTYGIIIYQEQVMQIAQTLAGFTPAEADILRKAMGKKKRAELERQKEKFINGSIKNGIKKDVANYVFTKIEPFAEYGFNKSHAAAYALIAYQTAFLKTYFKEDFIAAAMTTTLANTSKLREYVEELKRLKIEVVRPCINSCYADFKADKNKIFYSLGAIKSVGYEAIHNIVNEREKNGKFHSLTNFINRVDPKDVNKLQLEGLVKAGAFDKLEINRKKLLDSIPKIIQIIKVKYEDKISNQTNLFDLEEIKDSKDFDFCGETNWSKKELLSQEFKSLGFFMSDHPLNEYDSIFKQLKIISYKEFLESDTSEALVAGTIMSIQEKKSSKGASYAIVKFSDNSGEFELFLFSELLLKNREKLNESDSFALTLQKDRVISDSSQRRVNIRKILNLGDYVNKPYDKVEIELESKYDLNELKEILNKEGNTYINLVVVDNKKKFVFKLKKARKFDFNTFNHVKNKHYVKKINF